MGGGIPYGVIYKITNQVNGKVYIGQTSTDVQQRWYEHQRDAESPRRRRHFHRAILKYGAENFIHEVLAEAADADALDELERWWIAHLDATNPDKGYNRTSGGKSYCVLSPEARAAMMGRVRSPESIEKHRRKLLGRPNPKVAAASKKMWAEERERLLAARRTPEAHANISNAQKALWTPERRAKQSETTKKWLEKRRASDGGKNPKLSEHMKRRWEQWRQSGRAAEHSVALSKRSREWWQNPDNKKKFTEVIWDENKRAEAREASNRFFASDDGKSARARIVETLKERMQNMSLEERRNNSLAGREASIAARKRIRSQMKRGVS